MFLLYYSVKEVSIQNFPKSLKSSFFFSALPGYLSHHHPRIAEIGRSLPVTALFSQNFLQNPVQNDIL